MVQHRKGHEQTEPIMSETCRPAIQAQPEELLALTPILREGVCAACAQAAP